MRGLCFHLSYSDIQNALGWQSPNEYSLPSPTRAQETDEMQNILKPPAPSKAHKSRETGDIVPQLQLWLLQEEEVMGETLFHIERRFQTEFTHVAEF